MLLRGDKTRGSEQRFLTDCAFVPLTWSHRTQGKLPVHVKQIGALLPCVLPDLLPRTHSSPATTQPWPLPFYPFIFVLPFQQSLKCKVHVFTSHTQGSQCGLRLQAWSNEKCFGKRQTVLPSFLKTVPTWASRICSQSISPICEIFFQSFLKHFWGLPRLLRICCYSSTADGTGDK